MNAIVPFRGKDEQYYLNDNSEITVESQYSQTVSTLNAMILRLAKMKVEPRERVNSLQKIGQLGPRLEARSDNEGIAYIRAACHQLMDTMSKLLSLPEVPLDKQLTIRALVEDFMALPENLQREFFDKPSAEGLTKTVDLVYKLNERVSTEYNNIIDPQLTLNQQLDAATVATQARVAHCVGGAGKLLLATTKGVGKILAWSGKTAYEGGKVAHKTYKARKQIT